MQQHGAGQGHIAHAHTPAAIGPPATSYRRANAQAPPPRTDPATAVRLVKVAHAVHQSPVLERALREREGANPLFAFLNGG